MDVVFVVEHVVIDVVIVVICACYDYCDHGELSRTLVRLAEFKCGGCGGCCCV